MQWHAVQGYIPVLRDLRDASRVDVTLQNKNLAISAAVSIPACQLPTSSRLTYKLQGNGL
jgi:hypothetical protein